MYNSFSKNWKGCVLMLFSACLVAFGQYMWKLYMNEMYFIFLILGFCLYGLGALFMIIAYKFGSLSVLQPILSLSYVLGIALGYFFLGEVVTLQDVSGVLTIVIGIVFIVAGD